jgi:hypothetical protein
MTEDEHDAVRVFLIIAVLAVLFALILAFLPLPATVTQDLEFPGVEDEGDAELPPGEGDATVATDPDGGDVAAAEEPPDGGAEGAVKPPDSSSDEGAEVEDPDAGFGPEGACPAPSERVPDHAWGRGVSRNAEMCPWDHGTETASEAKGNGQGLGDGDGGPPEEHPGKSEQPRGPPNDIPPQAKGNKGGKG